jgi:Tol biopolymer transport system component
MTFLDIIQMRFCRAPDISPDGKWFIYVLQIPDWKNNKKYSDIYLTPLSGGATRQMTFTVDRNERSPTWCKNSSFFAFISGRSEAKSQVFFMSLNGGDVRQVSSAKRYETIAQRRAIPRKLGGLAVVPPIAGFRWPAA